MEGMSTVQKLQHFFEALWDDFGPWIIGIGCVIGIAIIAFAGYSFFTSILVVVVFGLALWKALNTFIRSIFFATLLKVVGSSLKPLTAVWVAEATNAKFYAFVDGTGWVTMILVAFLLLYAVSYVLGLITELVGSFQPIYFNQHVGTKKVSTAED